MKYTFVKTEGVNNWRIMASQEADLPTGEMSDTLIANMKSNTIGNLPDVGDPMRPMALEQAMVRLDLIEKMGGVNYSTDNGTILINENGGYCSLKDYDKIIEVVQSETFPV